MTTISYGGKSLRDELAELVAESAPRRFALCWTEQEPEDGGVLYWGVQLAGGRTVLIDETGRHIGMFSSPERAQQIFSRLGPVHLIWLDPASPP